MRALRAGFGLGLELDNYTDSSDFSAISSYFISVCSLCTAATVLLLTEKCRTSGDFGLILNSFH